MSDAHIILRKDIKSFIRAIRNRDNPTAFAMLDLKPGIVKSTAKAPPKKDDGQSPLQIAFKVGNFDAAEKLLDCDADPTFIEQSEINEWRAPVLHDAIKATIFSCKTLRDDTSNFQHGMRLLGRMLESGADPNACDTYGNTGAMRAVLDANQMLNHSAVKRGCGGSADQIRQVFDLLTKFGADFDHETETRPSARSSLLNKRLDSFQLL